MKFETPSRGSFAQHTNISLLRRVFCTGTILVAATYLSACGKSESPALCESPRASSQLFDADPAATDDRNTWKNGMAIHTEIPADAQGIVVGFRGPNSTEWRDSLPISQDMAQNVAVRLGNGSVFLSIQTLAAEGSVSCTNEPTVTFGEVEPMNSLIATGATLPKW